MPSSKLTTISSILSTTNPIKNNISVVSSLTRHGSKAYNDTS